MEHAAHKPDEDTTVYGLGSINGICPECQGPAERIPRRWIDRLTSLILPRHRYRCRSWVCRWEGNLRIRRR